MILNIIQKLKINIKMIENDVKVLLRIVWTFVGKFIVILLPLLKSARLPIRVMQGCGEERIGDHSEKVL